MDLENQLSAKQPTRDLDEANEGMDFKLAVKDAVRTMTIKKKLFFWVCGFGVALGIFDHYYYPSYTLHSYLMIESQNSNSGLRALLGSLEMLGSDFGADESEDHRYLLALKSGEFEKKLDEAIQTDPEFPKYKDEILKPRNIFMHAKKLAFDALKSISGKKKKAPTSYAVAPSKMVFLKKGVLEVAFAGASPETVVFVTNHFLDTAVKVFATREAGKISEAKNYLQSKIDATLVKMADTDRKMIGMSTSNATLSLLAPQHAISERLLDFRSQIQKHELVYNQNEKILSRLRGKLSEEQKSTDTGTSGSESVVSMFGVRRTIADLESDNELLKMKIETLKRGLEDTLKANLALPKEEQKLSDLKRDKGLDYYIFDNLIKTLLQVEVKGLSLISRVYPLEKGTLDRVEVTRSIIVQVAMSLMAALFLTALTVFGMNYINPVVRSKKDFENLPISHLGDIATIPDDYFNDKSNPLRLCRFNIESKETIALKHVRSKLVHLSKHSGTTRRQVISLMSYGNNEGKSFISSNLALCFSKMSEPCLLIDFDLRRGALTKQFRQSAAGGMCSFLNGESQLDDIIVKNALPNLDFIPAGAWTPATTEHFSNEILQSILETLKKRYSYIIIDTAPMVVAFESLAIAQVSDFAVFVATAWKTRREYVIDAIDEIRSVRSARIHFILNRTQQVKDRLVSNYYYYMTSNRRLKNLLQTQPTEA